MLTLWVGGCSVISPKQQGAVVASDTETQELAALFDESPESAGAATSSAPPESKKPTPKSEDAVLDVITGEKSGGEVPAEVGGAEIIVPDVATAPVSVSVTEWQVIDGGLVGNAFTGVSQVRFQRPVAVAARGEYVYVVDAGLNAVFRYDRVAGRLESVLDLGRYVSGQVSDILVAPDFSFYIADPTASRVLLFDRSGHLLETFSNRLNMVRPVALALDNEDLIVADGNYDYLVRFNSMGQMIATYASRGLNSGEFLNITTMAEGPDGYYVGARIGRRIQVLSPLGDYRYSFEAGVVNFPSALVVDSKNRSYVSDYMDDQIKVYDHGRLISTIGGHGVAPGRFSRIEDLWLDDHFLYVADSLNGRIQIGRLTSSTSTDIP